MAVHSRNDPRHEHATLNSVSAFLSLLIDRTIEACTHQGCEDSFMSRRALRRVGRSERFVVDESFARDRRCVQGTKDNHWRIESLFER